MVIKKRILIIDDEEPIRRLLRTTLEAENYIVFDIPNGEGVDIVFQSVDQIDLVITDLMIPGEHGIDIMIRIREKYKIPVLAISGVYNKNIFEDDGIEFYDGFLSKPIDRKELLTTVSKLLSSE